MDDGQTQLMFSKLNPNNILFADGFLTRKHYIFLRDLDGEFRGDFLEQPA